MMAAESVSKRILKRLDYYFYERPAIRRALLCQGWSDKGKLSVLYRIARETGALDGDILEIGSAWGRSAVLLGHASAKQIWSIDPHTGGRAYIERGEAQDSFEIFKANLTRNGLDGRVIVLKYTTGEVIEKQLLPQSVQFSMAFIDGLHTARGVEVDFGLAFERLVHGGIMVFDDYFQESIPDYTEMIDKLAIRYGLDLVKDKDSKLVYFKKHQ
jgi:predicted O-methyltransferase YrrM